MKPETVNVIRAILAADETVSKEQLESFIRHFKQSTGADNAIDAKEAMRILGISRPTLRSYVKAGLISQIAYSPRKVMFDEDEIRHFALSGIHIIQG